MLLFHFRYVSEDCFFSPRIQSLHLCLEVGFHDENGLIFDTSKSVIEYSHGSTSVELLFVKGMVLVDILTKSRVSGFAFAFDRIAELPAFNFYACSSNCISEVSCSLLSESVTNLCGP